MSQWQKTDYPGVRFRKHPTRKHKSKPDRYFTIRFMIKGVAKEEPLGWSSEGWTPALANAALVDRKRGRRPVPASDTLKEISRESPNETATVHPPAIEQQASHFGSTFKKAADLFIDWAKVNKKSWRDDQQRLTKHVLPILGHQFLSDIGFPELETLKMNCQHKGLAPATVHHCLKVARIVFNFASKMRLYNGNNPLKEVKFPAINNRRLRFLTRQEAQLMLKMAASYNRELHDLCLFALYTGLRAGEILALRWFDIDFKHELITVRDSKNSETRQVFMAGIVMAMLMNRTKDTPGSLVFPTNDGRQRVRVSKIFLRLADKLEFNKDVSDRRQRVCFHTLRHTFASWLAMQGETLLTIKELMGHKTIAMTMRYAHLIPDQKREAVAKLASMVNG